MSKLLEGIESGLASASSPSRVVKVYDKFLKSSPGSECMVVAHFSVVNPSGMFKKYKNDIKVSINSDHEISVTIPDGVLLSGSDSELQTLSYGDVLVRTPEGKFYGLTYNTFINMYPGDHRES